MAPNIKTDLLITDWDSPDEQIKTKGGFISYREWCEREAARMAEVRIVERRDPKRGTEIALSR